MFNCLDNSKVKNTTVNFGPQHPAAHGVLRLNLDLQNERILKCDPHIGLLHRGTELLMTKKTQILSLPYFDRLDYVSMLTQEHAYVLNIEHIAKRFKQPLVIQQNRIIMDEVSRILNHLLALACHALDVGSMSSIFWAFEERENFMEIYENISGARMHTAFMRPIFFNKTIKRSLLKKLVSSLQTLPITISEVTSILNINKVWKVRLKNVGIVSLFDWNSLSISGVLARSLNLKFDLRQNKSKSYSFYPFIQFNSFIAKNGDSLDRYNLRMYEIMESLLIISNMSFKSIRSSVFTKRIFMENVIDHFKIWSGIYSLPKQINSLYIESSKGLFGVNISLKSNSIPVNCKIHSPAYNHLFLMKFLAKGLQLADLITLIGTVDVVFGEIDR